MLLIEKKKKQKKNLAWGVEYSFLEHTAGYSVISPEKKNHLDSTLRSVLLNGTVYVVGVDLTSSKARFLFTSFQDPKSLEPSDPA